MLSKIKTITQRLIFPLIFAFLVLPFIVPSAFAFGSVSAEINAQNGYPFWYADNGGTKVMPCLDGSDPICVLPAPGEEPNFDPGQSTQFPNNFPSEFFYWIAESNPLNTPGGGKTFIRYAAEGAFLNENPVEGDQMVFGRIRVTGTGLTPNSTYFVTHPYGIDTYKTDETGIIRRGDGTEDVGCEASPCNFSAALDSKVFRSFLRWDTGAPSGYLGDGVTPHRITGNPTAVNYFKIQGPGLPAGGLQTNLFVVSGKLFVPPPPPPPGCENTAPDAPTLSQPANGAVNISTNPVLSWNALANFGTNCTGNINRFQLFLDEGNVSPATLKGTLLSTTLSQTILNLKSNTLYSWKIRAANGVLTNDSQVFTFTTTSAVTARAVSETKDPGHGFPDWYRDDSGTQVMPCLDGTDPICVLPAPGEEPNFDPSQSTQFPNNFPSEFFYWIAESNPLNTPGGGKTFIRYAAEGAFLNENPVEGDQMVFGRIRVTGTGLTPNSTYTVIHAYGTDTYETDEVGVIKRPVGTEDIGCEVGPCDFSLALGSRVFGNFIRWDTAAPAGYLGDGVTPHAVTGSPTGNNYFKIQGPGLPEGGLQTSLFTVSGKLSVAPPPPGCENTAPDAPTLSVPANGATGISINPTLSWSAVANFGTNCAGNSNSYKVLLNEGNVTPVTVQGTTTEGTTSLLISNLKFNTTYSWRVQAANGALSTDSAIRTFTTAQAVTPLPSSPRFLTNTSVTGGVRLSWRDSSSNETRFEIERRTGTAGVFSQIATTGPNTTTYIDATAPSGWNFWRVKACNAGGCSSYTNTTSRFVR